MTIKAFSYLRFSTAEQAAGDSFRRQTALAADYARRHGLEMDERVTFHDLGVSAYRGRNAEDGRLGDFREAVRVGLVPRGSFLLVESLDRISRQAARKALRTLEDIMSEGVAVVTLTDERTYTLETIDRDPMSLMIALLTFIRANEESETKSRRLRAAWSNKRANAATRPVTAMCPAWLRLDRAAGRFEIVEDRAAIVRRIFEEAARGVGLHGIATGLNRDGIVPFGIPGRRTSNHWQRSYLMKLMDSHAPIGVFVPRTLTHEGGKAKRTAQDPVGGYYPAIISEEVFQAVRAQRSGVRVAPRTRSGTVRNLLAGLASCPACSSTMTRVTKGSGGKAGKDRLACVAAKAGRCAAPSAVLEEVETRLRESVARLCDDAPRGSEAVLAELEAAEVALEGADALIERALDAHLSDPRSVAIKARLDGLEAQRDRERETLEALKVRAQASAGPLVEKRLERIRETLSDPEADPAAINAALRQALEAVTVDAVGGVLTMHWRHGGQSVLGFSWPAL